MTGDSGSGALADAGPEPGCRGLLPFTPSNIDTCALGPDNGAVALDRLGVYDIDTDLAMMFEPGGATRMFEVAMVAPPGAPAMVVVLTSQFQLGAESVLAVSGSRTMAVVATGDISIAGFMNAGAHDGQSGPGGDNAEACPLGRGLPGGVQMVGSSPPLPAGSGGGGGGFAEAGGSGGQVSGADDAAITPGGQADGNSTPVPLRGGCAGAAGGSSTGGGGGGGGGALQFVAAGAIRIEAGGTVTVRGGGGGPVQGASGGGGGGGSGGTLLLEAMNLEVHGRLAANGGSGGEGAAEEATSDSGRDGFDDQIIRVPGGNGMTDGGDGGDGGAFAAEAGAPGQMGISNALALAGGGGGGGSAGRIFLRSIAAPPAIGAAAMVSPAPQ